MIPEHEILLRILVAAGLGMAVGFERERQHQAAGLRTHTILVIGATLAMTLSINLSMQFRNLAPNGDPARLAAQVLSGIGFLGAGAILRFGPTVKGLTTATSLWTMAVVGLAVGLGYFLTAVATTALLLLILLVLNYLEDRLISPYVVTTLTVIADDRPGMAYEIRKMIRFASHEVDSFRLAKRVRVSKVRVLAVVKIKDGDPLLQLADRLAELPGVDAVKFE